MGIDVRAVSKRFGGFSALEDVSLEVRSGELLALLGPSGSGKTTLLRIIAGLEVADSGSLIFHGEDATARRARDREVGFVFQHYALFKHMTVFENVAFGLSVKRRRLGLTRAEIARKVGDLLKLVQMDWLADRYPSQLSGGQRQRVALVRALAVEPKVVLLDEPFGALDAKVRGELRRWIRRLHDEIHLTSVFVTHDQDEALEVADRVVIMNQGKIEQIGTPEEVYDRPANLFVYTFLGNVNLFRGRHAREGVHPENGGGEADAYVRPHEIELFRERRSEQSVPIVVSHVRAIGPIVRLELKRADTGDLLEAELTKERYREIGLAVGEAGFVDPRNLRFFESDYSI